MPTAAEARRFAQHAKIEAAVDRLDQALRENDVLDWYGALSTPPAPDWQRRVIEHLIDTGALELPRGDR